MGLLVGLFVLRQIHVRAHCKRGGDTVHLVHKQTNTQQHKDLTSVCHVHKDCKRLPLYLLFSLAALSASIQPESFLVDTNVVCLQSLT